MARLGVLAKDRFLTTVAIVITGRASGMAVMQLLHHALKDRAPTPLVVDDSDTSSPAFFFDATFDELTVSRGDAQLPVRATVLGVKGFTSSHLPTLLSTAHAVLVMSDGSDDPTIAARTLAGRVDVDKRGEVHAVKIATASEAHEALFAVLHDIVTKANATATAGN